MQYTGKHTLTCLGCGGLMMLAGLVTGANDAAAPPGTQLVLIENGESRMPVVVFADAPPRTRQAADELAAYIEKVSGARPPVIEGRPEPLPEHAIWVGVQPVLKELFPEQDFEFKHPEEILIAANANHLVIAGRDRWDPQRPDVDVTRPGSPGWARQWAEGVQWEYGTINAVYTFLQEYLDVRWLWPGEMGEDIIKRERVALKPFEYRYHPQFRARAGVFHMSELLAVRPRGQSRDWLRFQRLQLDSLSVPGGHGFTDWWARFRESHPEYLALQPDGSRGGGERPYPQAGNRVKMCKSNPDVWARWVEDVADALERNPYQLMFNASANDNWNAGYCICDNCRAWDRLDGHPVTLTWQGLAQRYVAMTDRQITLANTLGRMLKERFPDRELLVYPMAYGGASLPLPVGVVPDDNVIVGVVANFHNRPSYDARSGLDHREILQAWGRLAPRIAWRPNLGRGAGWALGFPNIAPRRVVEDFRLAAESGVIGLCFDTVWEHWANQGPHYYMLAQLAWNPYADGEAILADYYRRAFGPAADAMTAYWTLMDKTSDAILFDGKTGEQAWDADFFRQAYAHLDRAAAAAVDAPDIYTRRLDFVRAGLDWLRLYQENRVLIARLRRLRDTGGEDAEALAAARANWQAILRIFEAHPLALNRVYVGPGRSLAEAANPDR